MWVVIMQTSDDMSPIYVGNSEKKAYKIAEEKEDIDNCCFCYVKLYKGEKEN